jgi:hypothetical protein
MEGLTRQEQLNQLRNAKQIVKELSEKLGVTEEETPVEERNPLAAEFDRMTPLQKYTLFTENRERWRELVAAKQEERVKEVLLKR